jgi:hypothetical protein
MCEITVILKDEERNLRFKFLIYQPISTDENDPVIQECIAQAKKNFEGEPEEITIKISIEIQ